MHLPLDVFTHIVPYLDKSSQKRLCLTSHDLVAICRSSLFHTLHFGSFKHLQRFVKLLSQSPHLAAYVCHLQYSVSKIDPVESQLASTALKALDRIQILTLTGSPHVEVPLIPDNLALFFLDIIRSPGLTKLHITDLPVWILRGVGLGLKSLTVHYDPKCKTKVDMKPTEEVETALTAYEESLMGRKVSLTVFRVGKHLSEVVRAFGLGSLSRLDLSELVDIQVKTSSVSFFEEIIRTAMKIRRFDWTVGFSESFASLSAILTSPLNSTLTHMRLCVDHPIGNPTPQDIPSLAMNLVSIPAQEDRALEHLQISITTLEVWYPPYTTDLAMIDQAITKARFPRLKVFDLLIILLTGEDDDLQTTEEYFWIKDRNERKCREIFAQVGNLDGVEFYCDVHVELNLRSSNMSI